jgi:hypothetical protein
MKKQSTVRYCADPTALSALARDGMGWGHDLECGTFRTTAPAGKPGRIARWLQSNKRK